MPAFLPCFKNTLQRSVPEIKRQQNKQKNLLQPSQNFISHSQELMFINVCNRTEFLSPNIVWAEIVGGVRLGSIYLLMFTLRDSAYNAVPHSSGMFRVLGGLDYNTQCMIYVYIKLLSLHTSLHILLCTFVFLFNNDIILIISVSYSYHGYVM